MLITVLIEKQLLEWNIDKRDWEMGYKLICPCGEKKAMKHPVDICSQCRNKVEVVFDLDVYHKVGKNLKGYSESFVSEVEETEEKIVLPVCTNICTLEDHKELEKMDILIKKEFICYYYSKNDGSFGVGSDAGISLEDNPKTTTELEIVSLRDFNMFDEHNYLNTLDFMERVFALAHINDVQAKDVKSLQEFFLRLDKTLDVK